MAFVLALRWSAPSGVTFKNPIRLGIPTPAGTDESLARHLALMPDLPPVQDSLPAGSETGTLRFDVASDTWTAQAKVVGRDLRGGIYVVERKSGPIMFAPPHTTENRVSIVVADGIRGAVETRLVAIDRRGATHYPSWLHGTASGGVRMQEFKFDLDLDALEKYRFQTRPVESLEFRGIALAPRRAAE